MVYIFDTSSFRVMDHYFPDHFPSFWQDFEASIQNGEILSAREVFNELIKQGIRPHLLEWVKSNKNIFLMASDDDGLFISKIFAVPHFQLLVSEKERLKGSPVADPFVIAAAKTRDGSVVTEEKPKANAPNIPNVCEHFKIACCNLEAFMSSKGWAY